MKRNPPYNIAVLPSSAQKLRAPWCIFKNPKMYMYMGQFPEQIGHSQS